MMKQIVNKKTSVWMLIITLTTLVISYGLEFILQLEPCPLCLMQRLCMIVLTFSFLGQFVSQVWSKKRWYFLLQQIVIVLGIVLAARQLWLQMLGAADNSICMPGFEAILNYFSWDTVIKMLFWGSNDCATVSWKLIGMPLSGWSMAYFIIMFLLNWYK